MHDDFSQQIAALAISISNLKQSLPERESAAREQADRLQSRLIQLAESVRHLSHQLHPAIVEHAGVAAALHSYCMEFTSLSGVSVSFAASGVFDDLSPSVAICIYRVTQEALQNVAKHAGTKQAEVELTRSEGRILLNITDGGIGCPPDKTRASGGLGLVSMKERVRLVNGTFKFSSGQQRGSAVTVKIPLEGGWIRRVTYGSPGKNSRYLRSQAWVMELPVKTTRFSPAGAGAASSARTTRVSKQPSGWRLSDPAPSAGRRRQRCLAAWKDRIPRRSIASSPSRLKEQGRM